MHVCVFCFLPVSQSADHSSLHKLLSRQSLSRLRPSVRPRVLGSSGVECSGMEWSIVERGLTMRCHYRRSMLVPRLT